MDGLGWIYRSPSLDENRLGNGRKYLIAVVRLC